MKQWKTITSSDYVIDNRKRKEILDKIKSLAKSYTPEWQFNEDDPDIGSVIALLFADQMQDNVRRYNTTLERDYVELVNMLGISPKAAYPAHSIVQMNMIPDTIPGQKIKKGTKLLGGMDEEKPIVFETAHGIYITEAKLTTMFMASGLTGKVIPLKGSFPKVEFISKDMEVVEDSEDAEQLMDLASEKEEPDASITAKLPEISEKEEDMESQNFREFSLFDFSGEAYGKTGLVMYHTHLFDEIENDIWMDLPGAFGLVNGILKGEYSLYYYGENGFEKITDLRGEKGRYLVFRKSKACKKVRLGNEEYSALLLKPEKVVEKNVTISDIRFSSSGKPACPDYVMDSFSELDVHKFYPFGKRLSLFSDLFIGHSYFSNPGAFVSIDFDLEFEKHLASLPEAKEEDVLKIIKKKPKRDVVGAVAEVYADEITIEYYNGVGWKKLPVNRPVANLFQDDTAGHCKLEFQCPRDWRSTDTGGYQGLSIRIQLIRSDNCYFQPGLHHCPVIKNLKVAYSYEKQYERPDRLISFQGNKRWDITNRLAEDEICPILFRSNYNDTALYLGFDKKMLDGPVGLMFKLAELERESLGKLIFQYSTRDGFSRLKLTDRTDGLNHTGMILFMPPSDMAKKTLEGKEAYWIKIIDEDSYLEKHPIRRPFIEEIALNAVEVDNIETMDEEEYYIDAFQPDMSFPLTASNILRVDVWVNEKTEYSVGEMKRLLIEEPGETYAEYDIRGEIRDFYVKWKEVDNFDNSESGDRHYVIDRINNRIHFGDGVNVRIPKNTSGAAFKTVVRCCDGSKANVMADEVDESLSNLQFVEEIHNPIRAYGGMDMETMEEALRRGTTVLNTRRRLISTVDYEREVLDYAHNVSQVRVVVGNKKDGSFDPEAVSVVLLMEDYKDGRFSFVNIRRRLKEHLLDHCELTVNPAKLEIVEPLFVEVSVEAWIKVVNQDDSFEIQQSIIDMLRDYLDPVKNNNWEIGQDVVESQIELRLNMEKGSALIRKMMIICRYRDEDGLHETEFSALRGNPYTIVTSGEHKIHFE